MLGFDASLTSSGFAYKDSEGEYHTGRVKTERLKGPERLSFIRECFIDVIGKASKVAPVELIIYEGYAMSRNANNAFTIGELGGVLSLAAWEMGIDVLLVPPSNLKQFTTGKGNADKDRMIECVASSWGYSVPQNDEADAFALLKLGEYYVANVNRQRSSIKQSAVQKCRLIPGRSGG